MAESLGIDNQVHNLLAGYGGEKSSEILKKFHGRFSVVDMFSHFWGLEEAHSCLNPEVLPSRKSKSESEQLRGDGNKAYQKKNLSGALKLYNLSILAAPHPPLDCEGEKTDSHSVENGDVADENDYEALPLAYANRSAVLFELKQYEDCLNDIERAFQYGYPESLQHKLVKRKEGCTTAMESSESRPERLATYHAVNPPVLAESNPTLPAMSGSVKVAFSPTAGRYLVAQKEILPGEVLVVEEVHSRCLYQQHLQTHCNTCFTRCLVPLPCPSCKLVVFCNQGCRRKGLSGQHSLECPILPALGSMNTCLIIPYRIVTKLPFAAVKDLLTQFRSEKDSKSPLALGFNDKGVYDPNSYRTIYCLVTNQEKRDSRSLFTICAGAFMLTKLLIRSQRYFVDDSLKPFEPSKEDAVAIGSALFHHIMGDLSNGHRYGELLTSGADGTPDIQNIGSWISPTLSLANHSCDQAVITCNKGNLGIMQAIQLIQPGQEVTTGYLRGYGTQNLSLRKEILTNNYLFSCTCRACTEGWPTFNQLPDNYQLKCSQCSHFINRSDNKCSSCGEDYSVDTLTNFSLKRIDQEVGLAVLTFLRMRKDFNMSTIIARQEDLRAAMKVIETMDRYVIMPNKIYANAKAFLAGLFRNQRDYLKIRTGF
ncbi:SET and MYND domain-containing protein 4-like [Macrobrachium rosenbergii]|uniref:SET and MYND domain-containing protein 4-like n=1 Tax=Macrobrachium rosenbergii TaxID=79674 RepID=UPI0034D4A8F8